MGITSLCKAKSQTGFTLVELMVVIALIAIISALAAPSFQELMTSARITSASNDVVAGLQSARMEAIRTNTRVIYCRSTAASPSACAGSTAAWTNWVVGSDTDNNGAINDVLAQGVFSRQVTIRNSSNITNSTVMFRPDSLARDNAGALLFATLQVCSSGRRPTQNAVLVHIGSGSRISSERATDRTCTGVVGN